VIGPLGVDRDVPDLVDDQELGLGEQLEPLLEPVFRERPAEVRGGLKCAASILVVRNNHRG
jgi:hypothetical protein